jgi:3-hydroxyacyl-CoA dehydrogenase
MALRVAVVGAGLIGQGIFGCFGAAFVMQKRHQRATRPAWAE